MLTQEQQIFEQIKKANNILITFKQAWSGDAVASALALFLFLKKFGKTVEVAAEKSDSGKLYSFLPGYGEIKYELDNLRKFVISLDITNTKVNQLRYQKEENKLNFIISPKDGWFTEDDITTDASGFKYDLIITVSTPDLESLGRIYDNDTEFFYQTPIINLDHSSTNEGFGQINFIELTAVSTSEIIFSLLESYSRDLIDEDIATCLLAGMITETKSFKTNNVTPRALLTASQLMSLGARREEIVDHLYRSKSLNILKLWGRVLARLNSAAGDQLIWSILSQADFQKTQSTESDLNEVIDEMITSIPTAKVIALIFEGKDSKTRAWVSAGKSLNALDLSADFNPAGDKNLVKFELSQPLGASEKTIISKLEEKLKIILEKE